MRNHALHRELEVAVDLARQAGATIMRYYRTGLIADRKNGDEPVTEADQAADRLIAAGLRAAFPEDGLLTEESDDDLDRLNRERVWIVDPLDGTTEFIAETGDFAVQIGLTRNGRPVLGVVYQPTEGQLFFAAASAGAFCVQNGQVTRLSVTAQIDPSKMCLVASRSHQSSFVEAARQVLGIRSTRRVGSVGLKVGLLARGECDLYLATTVSKEWDTCAPDAILREAGGKLSNLCGEELRYNKPDITACTGLIGSNALAHGQIVRALAPLRPLAER